MNRLTVPDVIPFFRLYRRMPGHSCWGCLHMVLEDLNLSNADVEYARTWAQTKGDVFASALCLLLLEMTKTQRARIDALISGEERW